MQAIRNYYYSIVTVKGHLNRVLRSSKEQSQITKVRELDSARKGRKQKTPVFARDPSNCASIQHIHTYDELNHKIDKKRRKK